MTRCRIPKRLASFDVILDNVCPSPRSLVLRTWVARFYSSFLDTLIIDKTDESYSDAIKDLGMNAHLADIIMHTREDEVQLAKLLLSV